MIVEAEVAVGGLAGAAGGVEVVRRLKRPKIEPASLNRLYARGPLLAGVSSRLLSNSGRPSVRTPLFAVLDDVAVVSVEVPAPPPAVLLLLFHVSHVLVPVALAPAQRSCPGYKSTTPAFYCTCRRIVVCRTAVSVAEQRTRSPIRTIKTTTDQNRTD